MMKSLSGLPDRMIQSDVGRYLAQFGEATMPSAMQPQSHPSTGIRCRALLWFASAPHAIDGALAEHDRQSIDARVRKDLNRYMDMTANERIKRTGTDLAPWVAVEAIVRDGRMSRAERTWLADSFGAEVASRIVAFLADTSRTEVSRLVTERREASLARLMALVPRTWSQWQQRAETIAATKPD